MLESKTQIKMKEFKNREPARQKARVEKKRVSSPPEEKLDESVSVEEESNQKRQRVSEEVVVPEEEVREEEEAAKGSEEVSASGSRDAPKRARAKDEVEDEEDFEIAPEGMELEPEEEAQIREWFRQDSSGPSS